MKAGRTLPQVDLERGEFHLKSIMNGFLYREDDISDLTRQLACQLVPVYSLAQAEVDIEREEESLP
jgi:hypothetical protein